MSKSIIVISVEIKHQSLFLGPSSREIDAWRRFIIMLCREHDFKSKIKKDFNLFIKTSKFLLSYSVANFFLCYMISETCILVSMTFAIYYSSDGPKSLPFMSFNIFSKKVPFPFIVYCWISMSYWSFYKSPKFRFLFEVTISFIIFSKYSFSCLLLPKRKSSIIVPSASRSNSLLVLLK